MSTSTDSSAVVFQFRFMLFYQKIESAEIVQPQTRIVGEEKEIACKFQSFGGENYLTRKYYSKERDCNHRASR